jgi:hypothetical protein
MSNVCDWHPSTLLTNSDIGCIEISQCSGQKGRGAIVWSTGAGSAKPRLDSERCGLFVQPQKQKLRMANQ